MYNQPILQLLLFLITLGILLGAVSNRDAQEGFGSTLKRGLLIILFLTSFLVVVLLFFENYKTI